MIIILQQRKEGIKYKLIKKKREIEKKRKSTQLDTVFGFFLRMSVIISLHELQINPIPWMGSSQCTETLQQFSYIK